MDTRFSVSIHALIMIAGSKEPLSSEVIAKSVGTNASYIRRITSLLKAGGIVDSHQGARGFRLLIKPKDLSLYAVYEALCPSEQVHVFDLHQNPNDRCIVGRHILPVLSEVFCEIDQKAAEQLRRTTLLDCMQKMQREIDRSEST